MNELEKFRAWLRTFPGYGALDGFQVDFTDKLPGSAGIFPDGLTELSRKSDIMGTVTVTNRYSFALYCVFKKTPGDDASASVNEDWVSDFQHWVQEQSARRLAPAFGDDIRQERITAQNGLLYAADDEGTAVYAVNIAIQCIKKFKEENKWMI